MRSQRFIITYKANPTDPRPFLLLRQEVEEFHELSRRIDIFYAFARITGKDPSAIERITLEVAEHYDFKEAVSV